MLRTKTLLTALTITSVGIAATSANAAPILINEYPTASTSNIVATESSIEPNTSVNGADRTVIEINGGFNPATGEHAAGTQQSWRSNNGQTLADQWIQWDLGASYTLDSIKVWNYNDSSRYAAGIRQVDIYVSNAAAPGDPEASGTWDLWAENAILTPGTGSGGYIGFDLESVVGSSLPAGPIRFVRFEVDSTFRSDAIDVGGGTGDGANVAGLAQIEFFQVPEPGSLALMGLGGLLVASRRRRA